MSDTLHEIQRLEQQADQLFDLATQIRQISELYSKALASIVSYARFDGDARDIVISFEIAMSGHSDDVTHVWRDLHRLCDAYRAQARQLRDTHHIPFVLSTDPQGSESEKE